VGRQPVILHFIKKYVQGGASAGLSVDMVLFPLDTIKTRLQSAQGFIKSGGFSGVYKGIGPQAIGSAPQAALFFLTYESFKYYVEPLVNPHYLPLVHMAAASFGEVVRIKSFFKQNNIYKL
jgi:solute carrier family 25 S-adenosylmethionine transporter 26